MKLDNAAQMLAFGAGLSAGAVLALLYELLALLRRFCRRSTAFLIELLYLLFAGALLFVLAQGAGGGGVRLFYLVSALLGAVLCRVLFGETVRETLECGAKHAGKNVKRLNNELFVRKKDENFYKKTLSKSEKIV